MKQLWDTATLLMLLLSTLSCQSEEETKRQQYITEGILIYKNNCANCHQTNGAGVASLYPPIAGSDYLADKNAVICLIRYGLQGTNCGQWQAIQSSYACPA
jgi:mono/diheme cytochrome c family protein